MAYDEELAARVRSAIGARDGVTEKRMFGGLAFLQSGKMFCGVSGSDLMVRVGPEQHAAALARPHVRPMDFTGRPMNGYVFVGAPGVATVTAARRWVELATAFVSTLPPKAPKKRSARSE